MEGLMALKFSKSARMSAVSLFLTFHFIMIFGSLIS
jgi:hypothetical protein